jgi:hypothetical protein
MSLQLPGVETVSLAARPAALAPAGPYPVVGVAETRQLGLSDGQVVRPTVEVRNERLVLVLDGRVVEWPASAQARPAVQAVAWQVRLLANGSAQLIPLSARDGSTSMPASAQPLAAVLTREASAGERVPDRIARLLVRPTAWGPWLSVLGGSPRAASSPAPQTPVSQTPVPQTPVPQTAGGRAAPQSTGVSAALPSPRPAPAGAPAVALAGGGAAAASPGPATVPGLRLPSMGLLDAQGLREAIGRSGLFAEAMLASSSPAAVAGDVKLALQAWWRRLGTTSPAAAQVSEALDDIEAAQLQSLSSRADGGLTLSLVLGFRDAAPVSLRIARDSPEPERAAGDDRRGWSVDIHTLSERWGPLWLHTRIEADERVALMMWAEREDLCAAARGDAARLAQILAEQGLRLERFQVIAGPRVDTPGRRPPPAAGAVLDLKA